MKAEHSRGTRQVDSSEILRFRSVLEIKRADAMTHLARLGNETRNVDSDDPRDIGDFCETTLSKEALFRQTGERRRMVCMIEAALARIQQGVFGVCVACGDEIDPRRLDALPWAECCLRCQEGFERVKEEIRYPSTAANQWVNLRRAV